MLCKNAVELMKEPVCICGHKTCLDKEVPQGFVLYQLIFSVSGRMSWVFLANEQKIFKKMDLYKN